MALAPVGEVMAVVGDNRVRALVLYRALSAVLLYLKPSAVCDRSHPTGLGGLGGLPTRLPGYRKHRIVAVKSASGSFWIGMPNPSSNPLHSAWILSRTEMVGMGVESDETLPDFTSSGENGNSIDFFGAATGFSSTVATTGVVLGVGVGIPSSYRDSALSKPNPSQSEPTILLRTSLVRYTSAMKILAAFALTACLVLAQSGNEVNIYTGPPQTPLLTLMFYTGTNLMFVCSAKSVSSETSLTIASATAAGPGVFTSTAHGFFTTSASPRPIVSISGATLLWASLNADWLLTPVDANTFTLANPTTGTNLDSTGFGALTGTVVLTTKAPRTNQWQWAIRRFLYDGSSNLLSTQWSFGDAGVKGIFRSRCDSRAAAYVEWK
jgi:hypothetical protein